jgi:hypothetical protein
MARRTLKDNHYSDLKSQLAIAERKVQENPADDYQIGLYNGLEMFMAKVDGREPKLIKSHRASALERALKKI